MKLPILYKLTETGNIQQWEIVVWNNSFYSREGVVGGKITENKPTHCDGKNIGKKNATSPEQQAQKEAEAKHKKKLEKGYCLTIEEAKKGKSSFFQPMLAFDFNDYKDEIRFPVYSQIKSDGIRAVVTAKGMFSRNGKAIVSAPHIFESLKKFFKDNPNAVLDGELFADKLKNNFNKICSLVKRTKPTEEELKESAEVIEYWVFDAPVIGIFNEQDSFFERHKIVSSLLKNINCIKIVKTEECKNMAALDYLYEKYLENGHEGQMVRLNKEYESKRSRNLLKRKEFVDKEFKILRIVEGVGSRLGTAGYMEFKTDEGTPFKSNIKGDFAYLRSLLLDKDKLIGKMATVKYFNLTPAPNSVPRFGFVISIRDYE